MIKVERSSRVFPPNCVVLLEPSNVWRARVAQKKMAVLKDRAKKIKDLLLKVLNSNATDWAFVMEDVLFAHRVTTHVSTKYSPFELLYNRKAILPIDIEHNTKDLSNLCQPFHIYARHSSRISNSFKKPDSS